MRINQNIPSLFAYNAGVRTQSSLGRSLGRLSTGLRITSAADDAAGLAISEKMRTQVRGLDQASRNAQDGISMIQTAEGALNETHSVLQRIRELSVQAANDVLTADDRSYIQLEVDELKSEIDRIANTTQFNKKKLLNGESDALWSSDRLSTRAYVRGPVQNQGNYRIEVGVTEPGTAEILKSNVLKLKHDLPLPESYRIEGDGTLANTPRANSLARADDSGSVEVDLSSVFTGGLDFFGVNYQKIWINTNGNVTFGSALSQYTPSGITGGSTPMIAPFFADVDTRNTNVPGPTPGGTSTGANLVYWDLDEDAGIFTVTWDDVGYYSQSNDKLNAFQLQIVKRGDNGDFDIVFRYENIDWTTGNASGGTGGLGGTPARAGWTNGVGSYFELPQSGDQDALLALPVTAGNTGVEGLWAFYVRGGEIVEEPEESTIGRIASVADRLYDLDVMWDANGRFLLDQPRELIVSQGGVNCKVVLYADDTIGDVRQKLNDAIAFGLGQSKYVSGTAAHFATYVEEPDQSNAESVAGTFLIRSAIPGSEGRILFSGAEDVLRALGLNAIQEYRETVFHASIYDAHSGRAVASGVSFSGAMLSGAVDKNVDVTFDPLANMDVIWNESTKRFDCQVSNTAWITYLHLAGSGTVLQIGANEREEMRLSFGDMSAEALGIAKVSIMTRASAARTISILDESVGRVSRVRARLGAYQNRIEHTIAALTMTAMNTSVSESRIREADMAREMTEFTKLNILSQAGNSMLAQSNQLLQNILTLLR